MSSAATNAGPAGLAALTDRVYWAGMSHRALYEACHRRHDPAQAYACGEEWQALGSEMAAAAGEFAERIRATECGWQGGAADSTREAALSLADWCAEAGATAQRIGDSVLEQARAGEAAIARMPDPVEFDLEAGLGGLAGGEVLALVNDLHAIYEQARAAQEYAAEVMSELEQRSHEIDAGTPECPSPPPDVTRGSPADEAPPSQGTGPSAAGGAFPPGGSDLDTAVPGGAGTNRPAPPEPALPAMAPRPPRGAPTAGGMSPGRSGFGGGTAGFGPLGHDRADPPAAGRPGAAELPGNEPAHPAMGTPGMAGAAGAAGGHGGGAARDHRSPGFLAGERVFDQPRCSPPVIGA